MENVLEYDSSEKLLYTTNKRTQTLLFYKNY